MIFSAINRHRWVAATVGGFFAVGFLLYGQTLTHSFLPFDDDLLITKNILLRSELGLSTIAGSFMRYDPELYIPLTFLSYQLDSAIGGLNPWIFHLTNVLLHIGNAVLVTLLGWTLTKKKFIAVGMGLLFLIHPLNVETVAWAAARKDLLSTFFFLGALITFLLYKERQSVRQYRFSIELFLLALLSKVMAITLPPVLLLRAASEGTLLQKKTWTELIPFFALGIIFFVIGLFGKKSAFAAPAVFEKILLAFKSTCFYIVKLFWPVDLRILYIQDASFAVSGFILPILFSCFLVALALYLLRKEQGRLAAFGIFFYIVTLMPTFLNTHKAHSIYFASDRYAYLPSVGLLLALCIGLDALMHVSFKKPSIRFIAMGASALAILFLGCVTFKQVQTWKNGVTLFTHALHYHPDSLLAHVNRGSAYEETDQLEKAMQDYDAALQLEPASAVTWSNKAHLLQEMNNIDEAFYAYQMALNADMGFAPAHLGIGKLLHVMGREKDARDAIRNAYLLDPTIMLNLEE